MPQAGRRGTGACGSSTEGGSDASTGPKTASNAAGVELAAPVKRGAAASTAAATANRACLGASFDGIRLHRSCTISPLSGGADGRETLPGPGLAGEALGDAESAGRGRAREAPGDAEA